MTSDTIALLQAAFDAQRNDHNMTYARVERDPVRGIPGTGETREVYGSKSTPFTYRGALPPGIRELGREGAWDMGPGEPFLTLDGPIDADLMRRAVGETSEGLVEVKPVVWKHSPNTPGQYKAVPRGAKDDSLGLFVFWEGFPERGQGPGRLNYYTDGPTEENVIQSQLVVRTLARYLELKDATASTTTS